MRLNHWLSLEAIKRCEREQFLFELYYTVTLCALSKNKKKIKGFSWMAGNN